MSLIYLPLHSRVVSPSSHHTVALTRIHLPPLRPHIQVDRADELEKGVVVRLGLAFLQPPVPPHQQAHEAGGETVERTD
jgi:hypothetical protein